MNTTKPRPVSAVTVYGVGPARTLTTPDALALAEMVHVPLMLGAMRPGHLGREMVTIDDLREWVAA